jgi:hypothetical protein
VYADDVGVAQLGDAARFAHEHLNNCAVFFVVDMGTDMDVISISAAKCLWITFLDDDTPS